MTLTAIQKKRLEKVKVLHGGAGKNGLADACVMQAVDWVYRNKDHFTDAPDCTPPSLRRFAIRLNDARWPFDEDRTAALRPLIPLLVGADASPKAEQKRFHLFADFAVREAAPYWFDWLYERTKKPVYRDHAAKMRSVAPIIDRDTAERARVVARAADAAAYAAAAAAYAAYAAYAADAAYAAASAADAAYAAARSSTLKACAEVVREHYPNPPKRDPR